jgi:uncharacterized protein (TIGR02996 family)
MVKADPGDELAWLALADWLEEHNQPGPAELHRLGVLLRRPQNHLRPEDPILPGFWPTQRPEQRQAEEVDPHEEQLRWLLARGITPVVPLHTVYLRQGVRLKLALIPPGTFWMGSPEEEPERDDDEGPRHQVTISRGFYLGIHPVTQAQWTAVMGTNPSRFQGEDRPVEGITWEAAQGFCAELTRRGKGLFRLPTEAEWEYACRAGTTTPFHFGPTITARQANYNACLSYPGGRKGTYRQHTTAVGSFPPNAFGLTDLHGNVQEWCLDSYLPGYYRNSPATDPRCYGPGTFRRVLRGGGWDSPPGDCRSARRSSPAYSSTIGVRVVMELA